MYGLSRAKISRGEKRKMGGVVSTSRIQMISRGRRVAIFRDATLSSTDRPWAGYPLEVSNTQVEPVTRAYFPKTTLLLCIGKQGVAHSKHRGVWNDYRISPGSLFIARGETEMQALWTSNAWSRIVVQLDHAKLQSMAPDPLAATENSLVSALTTKDARVSTLLLAMQAEIQAGCPSGRLFGELISLALLAYLAAAYATPRPANDCASSLAPPQLRCIVDHIRANLGNDITVTELANLLEMSPSHFARVFKASFGITPYRFIMRERIEMAKDMLTTTKLSASQVAMAFGFASQSHFVKVFRQFAGVTPKQYKAGL